MAVNTVIFGIMTYYYKYVENTASTERHLSNIDAEDREALVKSSEGAGPQPLADKEKKGE